jgi:hypothetical protein
MPIMLTEESETGKPKLLDEVRTEATYCEWNKPVIPIAEWVSHARL